MRKPKPHVCKRCKTGIVLDESWAQSGRLCPPCVEEIKAGFIQAIEAQLPALDRLARVLRTEKRQN